jgi:peptidoglycan/xylan/chitin deacetylase (PgdA/CDA1 family)
LRAAEEDDVKQSVANICRVGSYCWKSLLALFPANAVLVLGIALGVIVADRPLASSPNEYPLEKSVSRANRYQKPDPGRIEDTLARFLYDWPQTVRRDRAAMARFFGFFRYEPAMQVLRKEAGYLHGEAAVASLNALAAMGDVDAVPVLRKVIRSSHDCEAVKVAAAALGRWRDHGSYSTLLFSLLEPECDGPAIVEIVRAILQLRHPYLQELMFFVHQETTSSEARLVAAAALAAKAVGPRRRPVEKTLRSGFALSLADLSVDPLIAEQSLLVTMWGMGRFSNATCAVARDAAMSAFPSTTGLTRQILARNIVSAGLPCLPIFGKRGRETVEQLLEAADDSRLDFNAVERYTRSKQMPGPGGRPEMVNLEPAWVDWLVQLATRFTLWDETRSVAQFAQSIERMERYTDRSQLSSPSQITSLDASVRVPAKGFRELAREAANWAAASDFDDYEFTGGQPEWWPSWIDITIDDGPRPTRLRQLMKVFAEYDVKATFFFIGVNIARYLGTHPEKARLLMTQLTDAGHRVGYHSMVHDTGWRRHLQNWSPGQIRDDIELWRRTLEATLGRPWNGVYGRLPGGMGRKLKHVKMGFDLAGLRAHVHWNVQDPTWGPGTSHGDIRALARRLARGNQKTIILLHEYEGLHHQLGIFIKELKAEVHRIRKEES